MIYILVGLLLFCIVFISILVYIRLKRQRRAVIKRGDILIINGDDFRVSKVKAGVADIKKI